MIHTVLLCGIPAFFLLTEIRRHWLDHHLALFIIKGDFWARITHQSDEVVDEAIQFWPDSIMRWELWRWDWNRYVVHQEHLEAMNAFIDGELKRFNLGMGDIYPLIQQQREEQQKNGPTPHATPQVTPQVDDDFQPHTD